MKLATQMQRKKKEKKLKPLHEGYTLRPYLSSLPPPYCVELPFQKEFLSLNRSSSSSRFRV